MSDASDEFSQIRDFYDKEYYGHGSGSKALPWHCRRIGKRLGSAKGLAVLDVACGTGEWLAFFRKQGATIAGIDLSHKAIDECQKRFPEGEFHCGPAETLPFEDDHFDLVTCMGSLEHFLDKPRALREMRRVAKPGATLLLLVPNAGFLTRRLGLYKGTQQVKAREDVLELSTWERLFADAGLRVTDRWRDLHPLSWHWICRGNVLLWPVRAMQALALVTWPVAWQYQVYHRCHSVDE